MAEPVERNRAGRKVPPRVAAAGAVAVVAAVFIFGNRQRVRVTFGFVDTTMALWLVLTLTFLAGLAVGALLSGRSRRKGKAAKR